MSNRTQRPAKLLISRWPVITRTIILVVLSSASAGTAAAQAADTTVIRAGAPRHPGVSTLVEELTLGKGSGAEEYQFAIPAVRASRDGGVFVIDISDPTSVGAFRSIVRKYDQNGRYVRSFGREGQGPGEYSGGVGDVKELPDGRVILSDARGILVYSPAGEPVGRWSAPAPSSNRGSEILVDPTGFVYAYGGSVRRQAGAARTPPSRDLFLYRFRFDGSLIDSVATPAVDFPAVHRIGRADVILLPRYLMAWSPLGYFVTAISTVYSLDIRRMPATAGNPGNRHFSDKVVAIRRTVTPVPVQHAERVDWRQSITMFNRSGSAGDPGWRWEGPDVPNVKPAIRHILVADGGRIWVRVSHQARVDNSIAIPDRPVQRGSPRLDAYYRWVEPVVFDVLEPGGSYIGQVRFPDGAGRLFHSETISVSIQGDTVWSIEKDQDDVPIIRKYRVKWGG